MRKMPWATEEEATYASQNNRTISGPPPTEFGSAGELGMLIGFLLVNGGCIGKIVYIGFPEN